MACASAKARSKSALASGRMLSIATSRIMVIFPLLTPSAHPLIRCASVERPHSPLTRDGGGGVDG
jgi:hypothetical protein